MARKETSTDEMVLPDAAVNLDKGIIETVEGASANDVAKLADGESFMRDVLEVQFADPANESESPIAEVTVNGFYHCYQRGRLAQVPRYVIEVLARSRFVRISTEKRLQPDRTEDIVPVSKSFASYPFSVIHDPAGRRGAEWLKAIMSQPA